MSITISSCFPGHWERTYTTTTTVTSNNGMGFANSSTTSSDSFRAGANRLGQSGAKIVFYNESQKEIKYIHFEVCALNRVGDIIGVPIVLKATGPVKKHALANYVWDYIWNDSTVQSICILKATIEYFDGTVETQSATPQIGEKRLNLDGAVGHSLRSPIWLAALWIAGIVLRAFTNTARWGLSLSFSITDIASVAMAVLAIATIVFSKQMKNRRATIVCSCMMSFLGIAGGITRLFVQIWTYRLSYYRFRAEQIVGIIPNAIVQLGTIAMFVLLLLSVFGTIKNYGKRRKLLANTVAWLCTFTFILSVLPGVVMAGGMIDGEVLSLVLDALLLMFQWGLVAAVASRCRCNYEIG